MLRNLSKVHKIKPISYNPVSYSQIKGLDENVRNVLKPQVLEFFDAKEDLMLKKKMNFLGFRICCRLNVAPKLLLQSITGDNFFRIVTKQLNDPWNYYFHELRQNGASVDKWIECIKQTVEWDFPYHTSKAYFEFIIGGSDPDTKHYNLVLPHFAKHGLVHQLCDLFDDLERMNEHQKPDVESFNHALRVLVNMKLYPLAALQIEMMNKRKIKVLPEFDKVLSLCSSTEWADSTVDWFHKGCPATDKSPYVKELHDNYAVLQNGLFESGRRGIQPPFELLTVQEIEDK